MTRGGCQSPQAHFQERPNPAILQAPRLPGGRVLRPSAHMKAGSEAGSGTGPEANGKRDRSAIGNMGKQKTRLT